MIEAKGLVKRYGKFTAVEGASLSLEKGETVALLGSNGSGKSTLLAMLAMILKPDFGEVTVDGLKGKKLRKR